MQHSLTHKRVVSARRTQLYSSSSKKHILHQLYCVWAFGRVRCEKRSAGWQIRAIMRQINAVSWRYWRLFMGVSGTIYVA